jgi:transposase
MTAKLENCTKEEQRPVIRSLWAEGVPGGQIHQHMCAQYGVSALSHRVVYEWIEMFKNGYMSVTDAERLGRPTTATSSRNEERAREQILQNRRATVNLIAKQLSIIIGSTYSVVHDNLQFHKVCDR